MAACHIKPKDKKAFVGAVGEKLVKVHGKQKYHQPDQVRSARKELGYPLDVECWALCVFCTPEDFKFVHDAAGEVCDYVAMKTEVLADLAAGAAVSASDVSLSWLDWPDIDLSSIFDWFDVSV